MSARTTFRSWTYKKLDENLVKRAITFDSCHSSKDSNMDGMFSVKQTEDASLDTPRSGNKGKATGSDRKSPGSAENTKLEAADYFSKRIKCTICEASFANKKSYDGHFRSKHNTGTSKDLRNTYVTVFRCELCKQQYQLKQSYNRHFRKKHQSPGNESNTLTDGKPDTGTSKCGSTILDPCGLSAEKNTDGIHNLSTSGRFERIDHKMSFEDCNMSIVSTDSDSDKDSLASVVMKTINSPESKTGAIRLKNVGKPSQTSSVSKYTNFSIVRSFSNSERTIMKTPSLPLFRVPTETIVRKKAEVQYEKGKVEAVIIGSSESSSDTSSDSNCESDKNKSNNLQNEYMDKKYFDSGVPYERNSSLSILFKGHDNFLPQGSHSMKKHLINQKSMVQNKYKKIVSSSKSKGNPDGNMSIRKRKIPTLSSKNNKTHIQGDSPTVSNNNGQPERVTESLDNVLSHQRRDVSERIRLIEEQPGIQKSSHQELGNLSSKISHLEDVCEKNARSTTNLEDICEKNARSTKKSKPKTCVPMNSDVNELSDENVEKVTKRRGLSKLKIPPSKRKKTKAEMKNEKCVKNKGVKVEERKSRINNLKLKALNLFSKTEKLKKRSTSKMEGKSDSPVTIPVTKGSSKVLRSSGVKQMRKLKVSNSKRSRVVKQMLGVGRRKQPGVSNSIQSKKVKDDSSAIRSPDSVTSGVQDEIGNEDLRTNIKERRSSKCGRSDGCSDSKRKDKSRSPERADTFCLKVKLRNQSVIGRKSRSCSPRIGKDVVEMPNRKRSTSPTKKCMDRASESETPSRKGITGSPEKSGSSSPEKALADKKWYSPNKNVVEKSNRKRSVSPSKKCIERSSDVKTTSQKEISQEPAGSSSPIKTITDKKSYSPNKRQTDNQLCTMNNYGGTAEIEVDNTVVEKSDHSLIEGQVAHLNHSTNLTAKGTSEKQDTEDALGEVAITTKPAVYMYKHFNLLGVHCTVPDITEACLRNRKAVVLLTKLEKGYLWTEDKEEAKMDIESENSNIGNTERDETLRNSERGSDASITGVKSSRSVKGHYRPGPLSKSKYKRGATNMKPLEEGMVISDVSRNSNVENDRLVLDSDETKEDIALCDVSTVEETERNRTEKILKVTDKSKDRIINAFSAKDSCDKMIMETAATKTVSAKDEIEITVKPEDASIQMADNDDTKGDSFLSDTESEGERWKTRGRNKREITEDEKNRQEELNVGEAGNDVTLKLNSCDALSGRRDYSLVTGVTEASETQKNNDNSPELSRGSCNTKVNDKGGEGVCTAKGAVSGDDPEKKKRTMTEDTRAVLSETERGKPWSKKKKKKRLAQIKLKYQEEGSMGEIAVDQVQGETIQDEQKNESAVVKSKMGHRKDVTAADNAQFKILRLVLNKVDVQKHFQTEIYAKSREEVNSTSTEGATDRVKSVSIKQNLDHTVTNISACETGDDHEKEVARKNKKSVGKSDEAVHTIVQSDSGLVDSDRDTNVQSDPALLDYDGDKDVQSDLEVPAHDVSTDTLSGHDLIIDTDTTEMSYSSDVQCRRSDKECGEIKFSLNRDGTESTTSNNEDHVMSEYSDCKETGRRKRENKGKISGGKSNDKEVEKESYSVAHRRLREDKCSNEIRLQNSKDVTSSLDSSKGKRDKDSKILKLKGNIDKCSVRSTRSKKDRGSETQNLQGNKDNNSVGKTKLMEDRDVEIQKVEDQTNTSVVESTHLREDRDVELHQNVEDRKETESAETENSGMDKDNNVENIQCGKGTRLAGQVESKVDEDGKVQDEQRNKDITSVMHSKSITDGDAEAVPNTNGDTCDLCPSEDRGTVNLEERCSTINTQNSKLQISEEPMITAVEDTDHISDRCQVRRGTDKDLTPQKGQRRLGVNEVRENLLCPASPPAVGSTEHVYGSPELDLEKLEALNKEVRQRRNQGKKNLLKNFDGTPKSKTMEKRKEKKVEDEVDGSVESHLSQSDSPEHSGADNNGSKCIENLAFQGQNIDGLEVSRIIAKYLLDIREEDFIDLTKLEEDTLTTSCVRSVEEDTFEHTIKRKCIKGSDGGSSDPDVTRKLILKDLISLYHMAESVLDKLPTENVTMIDSKLGPQSTSKDSNLKVHYLGKEIATMKSTGAKKNSRYKCEICEIIFRQPENLKLHYQSCHNEDWSKSGTDTSIDLDTSQNLQASTLALPRLCNEQGEGHKELLEKGSSEKDPRTAVSASGDAGTGSEDQKEAVDLQVASSVVSFPSESRVSDRLTQQLFCNTSPVVIVEKFQSPTGSVSFDGEVLTKCGESTWKIDAASTSDVVKKDTVIPDKGGDMSEEDRRSEKDPKKSGNSGENHVEGLREGYAINDTGSGESNLNTKENNGKTDIRKNSESYGTEFDWSATEENNNKRETLDNLNKETEESSASAERKSDGKGKSRKENENLAPKINSQIDLDIQMDDVDASKDRCDEIHIPEPEQSTFDRERENIIEKEKDKTEDNKTDDSKAPPKKKTLSSKQKQSKSKSRKKRSHTEVEIPLTDFEKAITQPKVKRQKSKTKRLQRQDSMESSGSDKNRPAQQSMPEPKKMKIPTGTASTYATSSKQVQNILKKNQKELERKEKGPDLSTLDLPGPFEEMLNQNINEKMAKETEFDLSVPFKSYESNKQKDGTNAHGVSASVPERNSSGLFDHLQNGKPSMRDDLSSTSSSSDATKLSSSSQSNSKNTMINSKTSNDLLNSMFNHKPVFSRSFKKTGKDLSEGNEVHWKSPLENILVPQKFQFGGTIPNFKTIPKYKPELVMGSVSSNTQTTSTQPEKVGLLQTLEDIITSMNKTTNTDSFFENSTLMSPLKSTKLSPPKSELEPPSSLRPLTARNVSEQTSGHLTARKEEGPASPTRLSSLRNESALVYGSPKTVTFAGIDNIDASYSDWITKEDDLEKEEDRGLKITLKRPNDFDNDDDSSAKRRRVVYEGNIDDSDTWNPVPGLSLGDELQTEVMSFHNGDEEEQDEIDINNEGLRKEEIADFTTFAGNLPDTGLYSDEEDKYDDNAADDEDDNDDEDDAMLPKQSIPDNFLTETDTLHHSDWSSHGSNQGDKCSKDPKSAQGESDKEEESDEDDSPKKEKSGSDSDDDSDNSGKSGDDSGQNKKSGEDSDSTEKSGCDTTERIKKSDEESPEESDVNARPKGSGQENHHRKRASDTASICSLKSPQSRRTNASHKTDSQGADILSLFPSDEEASFLDEDDDAERMDLSDAEIDEGGHDNEEEKEKHVANDDFTKSEEGDERKGGHVAMSDEAAGNQTSCQAASLETSNEEKAVVTSNDIFRTTVHSLNLIPSGFCFQFFRDGTCKKGVCNHKHEIPENELIFTKSLKEIKLCYNRYLHEQHYQHMRRAVEIFTFLKSANCPALPPVTLKYLFELAEGESDARAAFSILDDLYEQSMLNADICSRLIVLSQHHPHMFADGLWHLFEKFSSLNMEPKWQNLVTILTAFSSRKEWDHFWKVMNYCNECSQFHMPTFVLHKAVELAITEPDIHLSHALSWFNTCDLNLVFITRLDAKLMTDFCALCSESGNPATASSLKMFMDRDPLGEVQMYLDDEEETSQDLDSEEEKSILNRIMSCKLTKNWQYLAEIFIELSCRSICGRPNFVDALSEALISNQKNPASLIAAYEGFMSNVNRVFIQERHEDVLAKMNRKSLALVGNQALLRCYENQWWREGERVLCLLHQNGIKYLDHGKPGQPDIELVAVDIFLQCFRPQCALRILERTNWNCVRIIYGESEELFYILNTVKRLLSQLLSQHMFKESLRVLARMIEKANSDTQYTNYDSVLDFHQQFSSVIMGALHTWDPLSAYMAYDFHSKCKIPVQMDIPQLRHLLHGCGQCGYMEQALTIYNQLTRRGVYPDQRLEEIPKCVKLNTQMTSIECHLLIADYLMLLYNHFCEKNMAGQYIEVEEFNLVVEIFCSGEITVPGTPTSVLAFVQMIYHILQQELKPPLVVYGEKLYKKQIVIIINRNSVMNYVKGLDNKGRKQGLRILPSGRQGHASKNFRPWGRNPARQAY